MWPEATNVSKGRTSLDEFQNKVGKSVSVWLAKSSRSLWARRIVTAGLAIGSGSVAMVAK